MIAVSLVPTDELDNVWFAVVPMLESALQYNGGRSRLDDLYIELMNGQQTLWVALDEGEIIGCVTVRIVKYQTGMAILAYEYLAGKGVHRWLKEGHVVCSRYAKEFGCTMLEVPYGRRGWQPLLEDLGYRVAAIRYELNLED